MSANTEYFKSIESYEENENWVREDPKRNKNNFKEQRRQSKKIKDQERWEE